MDTPLRIRELVIQHHHQGKSTRAISSLLNISKSSVNDLVRKYIERRSLEATRRGKCGRKKKLGAHDERILRRASVASPQATSRQLQAGCGGVISQVSLRTVRRTLVKLGQLSYRPLKSPNLTPSQCRVRLQWARDHRNWTLDKWRKVIIHCFLIFEKYLFHNFLPGSIFRRMLF
jgi:transposase